MESPARRTKKVGRMLDQKLVEIELAFEIVIGRRRKARRHSR
jgi:hypothetical protein